MTETSKRPTRRVRPEIQNKKVKKWSSLWAKWILIWLWIFFILIIWIIFFFFFYLTKNPQIWKWIWLSTSAIKSITTVFALLFFWSFFILFLIWWIISLYKLFTKPSLWRWIWVFIILILWLTNLWFWWIVFSQIHNIKEDTWPNTTEVLIANAIFSDSNQIKPIYKPLYINNYPLIGPQEISFKLNKKIFLNTYLPSIKKENWNVKWLKFVLSCGNWQKITYKTLDFSPYKYCLYLKKWNYTVNLTFYYLTKNWQTKTFNFPEKEINIQSQISIRSKYKLNDEKNEIIGWEVWDLIKLDLTSIPLDLWLENNNILIDFEWNWKFKNYKWIATHIYHKDKLYFVRFKIPDSEYPTYMFPLRILPSTKPTCNIQYKEKNNNYIIMASWQSPNWPITKYYYSITNLSTNELIKKWTKNIIKTHLKNWSNYLVKFKLKDTKWLVWECSTIINLSDKVTYNFNVIIKSKNLSLETWNNNIIVNVQKIPTIYTINISNITPQSYDTYGFDIDQDWTIDEKTKTISITISSKKDRTITAIVKDQYGNITKKTIKFKIDLKPVVAILKAFNNKWDAPLKVKFDASSSYVTTTGDNISFFNWDFWDGSEKIEFSRQWIIQHTYKKSWEFIAKVTVTTDKWHKATTIKKIIVYKPVKSATIIFPDNLWWQIEVWNTLNIQLNTNWTIKHIHWDFGDGNIFDCDSRECTNITHIYHKPGLFTITATVSYLDWSPTVTTTAKINVIWN